MPENLAADLRASLVEARRRRYDRCCEGDVCAQHLQWDAFLLEQESDDFSLDESAETDYNGIDFPVLPDGWDPINA